MEKATQRSEVYSLLGILSYEAEFVILLVEEVKEKFREEKI